MILERIFEEIFNFIFPYLNHVITSYILFLVGLLFMSVQMWKVAHVKPREEWGQKLFFYTVSLFFVAYSIWFVLFHFKTVSPSTV